MSAKIEKTENANEVKMEITVEAAKFDEAMKKVYAKTAKYFSIPGFRRGKAPMHLVERQYGSEIFYEDTFNEVAPEAMEAVVAENNLVVVSRPDIEVSQIGKGKDLVFTAVIQTKPEIEAPKYKGVSIKKVEYPVTEEMIEHELGHMAERNARVLTVEEGTLENKDIAVMDFEGFVDGVAFEGGKAENHELEIGSNTFIPGFEEQMVGMKVGEEKDIHVTFPEEYHAKDLAGKEAVFKVKVHEIKRKELPTMDDEFAKDVSEFDTLEALKNSIKEKLEEENTRKAKYEMEDAAIKAVCDTVEVDIPSGMVETEIDHMLKDLEARLSYQGISLDLYLKMMNKTEADVRSELAEQAKTSVKTNLVLEAVIKAADVQVEEETVQAKIKEMAAQYGRNEEEMLENVGIKDYIEKSLKTEKAINTIMENAKIK